MSRMQKVKTSICEMTGLLFAFHCVTSCLICSISVFTASILVATSSSPGDRLAVPVFAQQVGSSWCNRNLCRLHQNDFVILADLSPSARTVSCAPAGIHQTHRMDGQMYEQLFGINKHHSFALSVTNIFLARLFYLRPADIFNFIDVLKASPQTLTIRTNLGSVTLLRCDQSTV